jgi:hypothetical protein
MKRRKKLWIACAALAVVLALCAYALIYRPKPYDFLSGARLDGVRVGRTYARMASTTALAPSKEERTTYKYALDESFESVTDAARRELREPDGWMWSDVEEGLMLALAWNSVTEESVAIYKTGGEGRQRAHVTVIRPTTLFDRTLAWLYDR